MYRSASWKAKLEPSAGVRWPIRCGHAFSADELPQLREGLWPQDMEDRWVVWLDGDMLRCWCSRTGTCVHESKVGVSMDATGTSAVLHVLDTPDTYRRAGTDAGELERFEGVLSMVWRCEEPGDALAGVSLVQRV